MRTTTVDLFARIIHPPQIGSNVLQLREIQTRK